MQIVALETPDRLASQYITQYIGTKVVDTLSILYTKSELLSTAMNVLKNRAGFSGRLGFTSNYSQIFKNEVM